jgi:hypothetical protein
MRMGAIVMRVQTSFLGRWQRLRHWLIRSHWRRWLVPLLCALPYLASLLWLLARGQLWIAQVMLAPVLMGAALAGLTVWLARLEFRRNWRSR